MIRRVALLGLSGVGKSTLIERLNARRPVLHLQASALIKAEQAHREQRFEDSESLRLGAVVDNQALMVAAFRRAAADAALPIVFDGHSVIDGRDGLVEIPSSVFAELEMASIFYLTADPDAIAARRLADAARERPKRTVKVLAEHQRFAHDAARRIAQEIGCPFIPVTDGDVDQIVAVIG